MNNLLAAIDAFTNPDSVWYYVVGVLFLVLIFAALAVYIVLSNKKKKAQGDTTENLDAANGEKTEEQANADAAETADVTAPAEAESKTDDGAPTEEKTEEPATEPKAEANEETAPDRKEEADEQPKEKTKAKSKAKDAQPVIKIVEKKPVEKSAEESEKNTEPAAKPAAKKSAPKKTAAKPFIDRLLATKSAHGVYNEIKNTVLSYPGMKAKLTKDDEQFVYVDKKMAAVALDGESVTLYLALDKTAVPSGFEVTEADGDFGIKMSVVETDIDSARKLIVFAMNVSMLTRNDKKRYVDYIQKAKDAKQRAKKK